MESLVIIWCKNHKTSFSAWLFKLFSLFFNKILQHFPLPHFVGFFPKLNCPCVLNDTTTLAGSTLEQLWRAKYLMPRAQYPHWVFSDVLLWTNATLFAWTENLKISGNLPVNFIWRKSSLWSPRPLSSWRSEWQVETIWRFASKAHFQSKLQCQCSWHPELSFLRKVCHVFDHSWCFFQVFQWYYILFEIRQTRTSQNIQRYWQNTLKQWHTDTSESIPCPFSNNLCHSVLFADYYWVLSLKLYSDFLSNPLAQWASVMNHKLF